MWKHKNTFAIGGLENVGYAPNQDFLIVVSSQGQAIFNCKTGEKIARKYDDLHWWAQFDQVNHTVTGFDFLSNIKIKLHGLHGNDNLPKTSQDNWSLVVSELEPDDKPFEKYSIKRFYLISPNKQEIKVIGKDGACELRALGFSDTGDTFIVALSCELMIYSRV